MDDLEIVSTLWRRIDESLKDENNLRFWKRFITNAEMLTALMEANDIISESNKAFYTVKTSNKKISMATHNRTIDNALVYIFLKTLITVPTQTKAYKLGLIDKEGRLIKTPKTKEEEDCISNLDLLMFKIRKWLASRMQYLSTISWLKGVGNSSRFQNYFSNAETLSRQYVVKRINTDLERLLSKG